MKGDDVYKRIFMMIVSFSMMPLMATGQRSMPVASSQATVAEQSLSCCEQVLSLCIFALCHNCDYRYDGAALDLSIEQAKACSNCPNRCCDAVKSCAQSIISTQASGMNRE